MIDHLAADLIIGLKIVYYNNLFIYFSLQNPLNLGNQMIVDLFLEHDYLNHLLMF